MLFQLHTATGKLKAEIIPTMPADAIVHTSGAEAFHYAWSIHATDGKDHRKITDIYHFLYFAQPFLQALSHFITYETTERMFFFTQGLSNLSNISPRFGAARFSRPATLHLLYL